MSEISKELAHDLKNPLTIIQGYSELLNDDCKDEKMMETISKIQTAVARLAELIDSNTEQ